MSGEVQRTIYASLNVAGETDQIADQIAAWVVELDVQRGVPGLLGEVMDRLHASAAGLGRDSGCVPGRVRTVRGRIVWRVTGEHEDRSMAVALPYAPNADGKPPVPAWADRVWAERRAAQETGRSGAWIEYAYVEVGRE